MDEEFRKNPAAAAMHEGLEGMALAWASPEAEEGIPSRTTNMGKSQNDASAGENANFACGASSAVPW